MGSRGTITTSHCNSRFVIVRGEEWGGAPFDGGGSGESGIERRAVVTAGEARGVKRRAGEKRRQSGMAGRWDGGGGIKKVYFELSSTV